MIDDSNVLDDVVFEATVTDGDETLGTLTPEEATRIAQRIETEIANIGSPEDFNDVLTFEETIRGESHVVLYARNAEGVELTLIDPILDGVYKDGQKIETLGYVSEQMLEQLAGSWFSFPVRLGNKNRFIPYFNAISVSCSVHEDPVTLSMDPALGEDAMTPELCLLVQDGLRRYDIIPSPLKMTPIRNVNMPSRNDYVTLINPDTSEEVSGKWKHVMGKVDEGFELVAQTV